MPLTPGVALNPTPARRGLKSQLLFHWRARDVSLTPLTGQVPTFVRVSAGGAVADWNGRLYTPVHSHPRWDVPVVGGESGLLLEYARTNLALNSSAIDSGATWTGAADFTIASAASVLAGQTAYKHTNRNLSGSKSRTQTIGVFSATGDTVYFIVENVNAATTSVGLYNSTTLAWVVLAQFTWETATLVVNSGSGSVFVRKLSDAGPNGGEVYLLGVSAVGTAGNTRRVYCYPSGTAQNGLAVILHHGQMEAGLYPSSPISTSGASVTRSTDRLTYPLNLTQLAAATDDLTLYARFARPNHAAAVGNIVDFPGILSLGGVVPYVQLYCDASARVIAAEIKDATPTTASTSQSIPAGAVIEVCCQVKDLTVAPAVAIDVGAGFGAFVTNGLAPITALGGTLGLGEINAGVHKLSGALFEAKVAQGLLSLNQMREAF